MVPAPVHVSLVEGLGDDVVLGGRNRLQTEKRVAQVSLPEQSAEAQAAPPQVAHRQAQLLACPFERSRIEAHGRRPSSDQRRSKLNAGSGYPRQSCEKLAKQPSRGYSVASDPEESSSDGAFSPS